MAVREVQVKAAEKLQQLLVRPQDWTRRDNSKTIVFTHKDGEQRFVVKPVHTNRERKYSKELGGGWYRVESYSTKQLAKIERKDS